MCSRSAADPTATRYRAFISYSHRDERQAARLHRRLESFRLPGSLSVRGAAARIRPVFRDRDELATSASLGQAIEDALDASAALIVVGSPAAAASRWVNEEIRYFRSRHPQRPVLAFVVDGDPGADPRSNPGSAALPLQLLLTDVGDPGGVLAEPLAADARKQGDGFHNAFLKLVAGLLQVPYDRLRQRELRRLKQRWALAGSLSAALAIVFALLAWRATVARDEARAARAQMEVELASERQTRGFLLSVFQLADSREARGETVTVREVLDTAVERIDSQPFARPVIKARFLATLGQAYSSLGLNRRSVELLQQSLAQLPQQDDTQESWAQRIDSTLELADVLFDMGSYDEALAALATVDSEPARRRASDLQRAQAANVRGDVLSYTGRDAEAMAAYRTALDLVDGAAVAAEADASIRSRSLGGMAVLHHFAGEYPQAQALFEQAVALLLPVFGERHPDSIWALVSWGGAAYANGDTAAAHEAWTRALVTAVEVLGETNPEVGTIKNNLGRLLLEEGDDAGAEALLRDALAIDRAHRREDFDDLVYPLANLALARMAQDDLAEAEALLREALPIAEAAGHPMLGDVLTGLADLACRAGRVEQGLGYAGRAFAASAETHGEADWHTQNAVLVREYCRGQDGQAVDRVAEQAAVAAVRRRWPIENVFSRRAGAQERLSS